MACDKFADHSFVQPDGRLHCTSWVCKLRTMKCFPVCPRKRTLLPSPTLGERRHRGLARLLVVVRRRAILMMPKGERPHPRHAHRRRISLEDATDDSAVGQHIVIVVVPIAGWATS